MKITKSKLRKMIRGIIIESSGKKSDEENIKDLILGSDMDFNTGMTLLETMIEYSTDRHKETFLDIAAECFIVASNDCEEIKAKLAAFPTSSQLPPEEQIDDPEFKKLKAKLSSYNKRAKMLGELIKRNHPEMYKELLDVVDMKRRGLYR